MFSSWFKRLLAFNGNLHSALQLARDFNDKCVFVFDLDSTLFCMKYRSQILIERAFKQATFVERFSQHLNRLDLIEVTERDWSIPDIMSRHGFSPEDTIVKEIERFWRKNFFCNDYLDWDQPYKGAVEFVQSVSKNAGGVYYLTARNQEKMYKGTLKSLKDWNFPLKDTKHLIMKNSSTALDVDYKVEHLHKLSKNYEMLCFFENEPVILNQVAKQLPLIKLFWIDSTHSGREKPTKKAQRLTMNYSL